MLDIAVERILPFRPEQLFDIAADIERYPQFLPWWREVRVEECSGERWRVENDVALGPLHLKFRSEAQLQRPQRIDVSSDQAPFEHLQLAWLFTPLGESGCRVGLSTRLQMRSLVMQAVVGRTLHGFLSDIMSAFEKRAQQLYVTSNR